MYLYRFFQLKILISSTKFIFYIFFICFEILIKHIIYTHTCHRVFRKKKDNKDRNYISFFVNPI